MQPKEFHFWPTEAEERECPVIKLQPRQHIVIEDAAGHRYVVRGLNPYFGLQIGASKVKGPAKVGLFASAGEGKIWGQTIVIWRGQ